MASRPSSESNVDSGDESIGEGGDATAAFVVLAIASAHHRVQYARSY
jgi:hypothetical protein